MNPEMTPGWRISARIVAGLASSCVAVVVASLGMDAAQGGVVATRIGAMPLWTWLAASLAVGLIAYPLVLAYLVGVWQDAARRHPKQA